MKINPNNVELIISAVRQAQYPDISLPEIALAGRSNVGKSSFINTMITRKKVARISSKPGKTQTLNFFNIDEQIVFVDVPGYGYAKVSKSERAKWGKMIEEYFINREQLTCCVQLIDIRHEPTEDDILMYNFLKYYNIPCIIVATKEDKIPKGKVQAHLARIKRILKIRPADQIFSFSSETKNGKDTVWAAIEDLV